MKNKELGPNLFVWFSKSFHWFFPFFQMFLPSSLPPPLRTSFFLLNQSLILSSSYFSFIISPSLSFLHFFSFLHFSFSRFSFLLFLFSFPPVYGMNVNKMIIVWMHNKLMNNYHLDFYSLACLSNICFTEPVTFAFLSVFSIIKIWIYILYKHFVINTIYWIKKWWNKIINFYLILKTIKAFEEIS